MRHTIVSVRIGIGGVAHDGDVAIYTLDAPESYVEVMNFL
jgi:hypothetical protein